MWPAGHTPQGDLQRQLGEGSQHHEWLQEVANGSLLTTLMLQSAPRQHTWLVKQSRTCATTSGNNFRQCTHNMHPLYSAPSYHAHILCILTHIMHTYHAHISCTVRSYHVPSYHMYPHYLHTSCTLISCTHSMYPLY